MGANLGRVELTTEDSRICGAIALRHACAYARGDKIDANQMFMCEREREREDAEHDPQLARARNAMRAFAP